MRTLLIEICLTFFKLCILLINFAFNQFVKSSFISNSFGSGTIFSDTDPAKSFGCAQKRLRMTDIIRTDPSPVRPQQDCICHLCFRTFCRFSWREISAALRQPATSWTQHQINGKHVAFNGHLFRIWIPSGPSVKNNRSGSKAEQQIFGRVENVLKLLM